MKRSIDRLGVCAAVSLLLLCMTLLPGAVFAEDAEAEAGAPGAPTAAETDAAEVAAAKNALITGEVTKVTKGEDGVVAVTLDDGKDGIILNIAQLRFVYDQKAKDYASLDDVKEGLRITAVLPANAPLALSAPPQTGAVFGLILNSDTDKIKSDIFDGDLVSSDKNLKLNIDADTPINKDTGEKRVFTAEDLTNQELIVFYEVVATSQPAQTSPVFVLILSEAPEAAPAEPEADEETAPPAEAAYVSLRAGAEAKGYVVTWVSKTQPITLEKGDITVTVTIGTDAFTYTHLTKDVQPLDSVETLDLVTLLTDGKTMVADTFIDLLK
jgi:hypothetical protein